MASRLNQRRKLTRSADNRVLAGVLGGLAEYFGWNAKYLRIAYVILSLTPFPGLLIYLLLFLIMPAAPVNTREYDGHWGHREKAGRRELHDVEEEDEKRD